MTKQVDSKNLALLAGLVGPVLFVLGFTMEGWLRPGYDAHSMFISALSLGQRGWIQIANFCLFGILLAVFALEVSRVFRAAKSAQTGPVFLFILAALFFISGPLVMDPVGTPQSQATLHGTIHGIAGGLAFLLMPISMFSHLKAFRLLGWLQSFRAFTIVLAVIESLAVIAFTVISKVPTLQPITADWIGLIQRAALLPFMVWLFFFALRQAQKRFQQTY